MQESLFNGSDLACLAGQKSNLMQSARDGDEVLLLLLEYLKRSQGEPGANPWGRYYSLDRLISNTLEARIDLLDRNSVPEGDAYAILAPLGKVLLGHHKLRNNLRNIAILATPLRHTSDWVS